MLLLYTLCHCQQRVVLDFVTKLLLRYPLSHSLPWYLIHDDVYHIRSFAGACAGRACLSH
jgi:hypothetical protein